MKELKSINFKVFESIKDTSDLVYIQCVHYVFPS